MFYALLACLAGLSWCWGFWVGVRLRQRSAAPVRCVSGATLAFAMRAIGWRAP